MFVNEAAQEEKKSLKILRPDVLRQRDKMEEIIYVLQILGMQKHKVFLSCWLLLSVVVVVVFLTNSHHCCCHKHTIAVTDILTTQLTDNFQQTD